MISKFKTKFLLAFLVFVIGFFYVDCGKVYAAYSWKSLGTAGFSEGPAYNTSLSIYNGTPYISYTNDGMYETVMKFDGSSWSPVGTTGFSTDMECASFCVDNNGIPYIAYIDESVWPGPLTVKKYANGSWETVGTPEVINYTVNFTSLYIDNGIPYVPYTHRNRFGSGITVKKFISNSWQEVGEISHGSNGGYEADPISLYVNNGIPYMAYTDVANGHKATVAKYDGSTFQPLGTALSQSNAYYTVIRVDNGTPYVAFMDGENNYKPTVKQLVYSLDLTITTATAISDINVANGTNLGTVNLPQTVTITLSDNTTTSAAVTWDNNSTPIYNGNTAGNYTFMGTITPPVGVVNTNNITTSVKVVVEAPTVTVSGSPTNATVTIKNGRATIRFTPPANDGGSPITQYTVTVSPGNYTVTGKASPIMVTGLRSGINYTFILKAINAAGESEGVSVSN
ncbi:Ig-like domain-containing protein [Clostridium magnum]|uniref:Bacterial Ig-like domain protein n=1 Tax=Clostridium magnum DSM 2767 TaxID=1121326 RepID=A0A161X8R2_9CLOT|nr:Ig-like domain-containing protein [Clostridium magnum]KZL90586.1 bacterial Ig-like domain protein [Clostridium magnum DSM 2767]SHI05458.1 Fibronectin type III domain-containing protein [Clostridium magnum DSM 2767]